MQNADEHNQTTQSTDSENPLGLERNLNAILVLGILFCFFSIPCLQYVTKEGTMRPTAVELAEIDRYRWIWIVPIFSGIALITRFLGKGEGVIGILTSCSVFGIFLELYARIRGVLWSELTVGSCGMFVCAFWLLARCIGIRNQSGRAIFDDTLRSKKTIVHDHWYTLIPNFTLAPLEFYDLVKTALAEREVPGLESFQIKMSEGGKFSEKRAYCRFIRERFVFDICAAPFGKGFFFSSRCSEIPLVLNPVHLLIILFVLGVTVNASINLFGTIPGIVLILGIVGIAIALMRNSLGLGLKDLDTTLLKTPVIGPIYEIFFRKETYFREDTRLMYMQTVPEVVKHLVEEVTATKGIKLLKQYETSSGAKDNYQPIVTRLNNEGPQQPPFMVVSMTPFANSPRVDRS